MYLVLTIEIMNIQSQFQIWKMPFDFMVGNQKPQKSPLTKMIQVVNAELRVALKSFADQVTVLPLTFWQQNSEMFGKLNWLCAIIQ